MCASLTPVIERVDFILAELAAMRRIGPHFRIVHRFHEPGTRCAPGEEVAAVYLVYRGREYQVRLPLALRLLADFLARNPRFPQSATQIVAGMQTDLFCLHHGDNADISKNLLRKISRSSVKVYANRIRKALAMAFEEAHLAVDPYAIFTSEKSVGNEVGYRWRATFEWSHVDYPGPHVQS